MWHYVVALKTDVRLCIQINFNELVSFEPTPTY